MIKKSSSPNTVVTEEYLDKRSEEILEVMKDQFVFQNQKLSSISQGIAEIQRDQTKNAIRINEHDVRIEILEQKTN